MKIMSSIVAGLTILAFSATPALGATRTANFSQGDRVIITHTINARAAANGSIAGKQPTGAQGKLVDGPQNAGGYTWWKVDYDNGVDGWSAEDFMQKPEVALQVPQTNVPATIASNNSNDELIAKLNAQLQALLAQISVLKASQTAGAAGAY